jgi:hypothetical protein
MEVEMNISDKAVHIAEQHIMSGEEAQAYLDLVSNLPSSGLEGMFIDLACEMADYGYPRKCIEEVLREAAEGFLRYYNNTGVTLR